MPKKVSEDEKKKILVSFSTGCSLEELSKIYNFSIQTITRQLKNLIGDNKFREIKSSIRDNKKLPKSDINKFKDKLVTENQKDITNEQPRNIDDSFDNETSNFFEITPLTDGVDLEKQKDLSSTPICDVDFPKVVYMIVDKKIELEIKYLKEYPEWGFLSQEELNRKTIEIFVDQKVAKRFCNKEQRVIKVPNTQVFKIAAPFLLKKGVSRIISVDRLIAL